jgi:hypothetical protein
MNTHASNALYLTSALLSSGMGSVYDIRASRIPNALTGSSIAIGIAGYGRELCVPANVQLSGYEPHIFSHLREPHRLLRREWSRILLTCPQGALITNSARSRVPQSPVPLPL